MTCLIADLPWEIVHLICTAADPETLHALSQLSRAWREAAIPLLYRHLEIRVTPSEALETTIDRLLQSPGSKHYLQHLRRLDVLAWRKSIRGLPSARQGGRWPTIKQLDPFFSGDTSHNLWAYGIGRIGQNVAPLVRLVSVVRRLDKLYYASHGPFPDTLLTALHQYHPSCRLTLSLIGQAILPGHDVVRSPCLHAVQVYYHRDYKRHARAQFRDFHHDAILLMLSEAPNLRDVSLRLVHAEAPGVRGLCDWVPPVTDPVPTNTRTSCLSRLSFSHNMRMTARAFTEWQQYTDFASLRWWNIGRVCEAEVVHAITRTALGSSLSRLQHLSVFFKPRSDTRGPDLDYWPAAEEMLQALPPLQYLSVVGARDGPFVDKILTHHGATLQGLNLVGSTYFRPFRDSCPRGPCFTAAEIRQFADRCPTLRTLQIAVERMQGRRPETEVYEALGHFPALITIFIRVEWETLDVEDAEDYLGDNSDALGEDPVGMGHLRRTLVNAAIDSSLALEIFETILDSQPTRRLQTLELSYNTNNPPYRPSGLLLHVLRPWRVTRADLCDPSERKVCDLRRKNKGRTVLAYNMDLELTPEQHRIVEPIWPQMGHEIFWWFSYRLQKI